jgi:Iap family predicted aminopeptidase
MTKRAVSTYLAIIAILLILTLGWYIASFINREPDSVSFDSSHAYADVQTQVSFETRIPGSQGHAQIREWMRSQLESAGWIVEVQQTERMGHPIYNIIAKRNADAPQIVLGAHYDTRMIADNDPDLTKRAEPVPGANDGASGVAVLLELARSLPKDTVPVWLVFFDTEDNGRIAGWDWILGSRAFAEEIKIAPRAVVVVDMIGDADLNIYLERNSNVAIRTEIWSTAEKLGYGKQFINKEKYSIEDDHTPFLEAGIPAVDIIDFDYPYWHTTQDTPDKVSAKSLQAVGDTLLKWITSASKVP